jgi:hypothetical protein
LERGAGGGVAFVPEERKRNDWQDKTLGKTRVQAMRINSKGGREEREGSREQSLRTGAAEGGKGLYMAGASQKEFVLE